MEKQLILRLLIGSVFSLAGLLGTKPVYGQTYMLENSHLARVMQVADGKLFTHSIVNKEAHTVLQPILCDEFVLCLQEDEKDLKLTNKDFEVTGVKRYGSSERLGRKGYQFTLKGKEHKLSLEIFYEMAEDEAFCHKYIKISSVKDMLIKKICVEAIEFEDACQNYTIRKLTAKGSAQWKPGLGQPVYTTRTGTFWGVEFPASRNEVKDKRITCGYLCDKRIGSGYTSYQSVVGVSDDPNYIDEAFYSYINRIRRRPMRLQVQYNSWFDYSKSVSKEKMIYSIEKINRELVLKRGCQPLDAYVIDDGWEDVSETADWSAKVWTTNKKFKPDFTDCFQAVERANSHLGLWLSPGCFFGARTMLPRMKKYGYETLSYAMSLTGESYMRKLEERILELTAMGISYFKFDGLFGHLSIRDFSLRNNPFATTNDSGLNDARFDEEKELYLVKGTERLISIFTKMHQINPEIFIAITNGAYLSSWWLQYTDIVWLINASDSAKGSDRTGDLVYRDQVYYQIWQEENTKFPMSAIFNHEPKKTVTGEPLKTFKDYLFMNLSRGTGFIELYIKTDSLSTADWDVLADGLKWAEQYYSIFKNVKMHGGVPKSKNVYGYSAWGEGKGYISMHNPSDEPCKYKFTLNRDLGISTEVKQIFLIGSPNGNITISPSATYRYGEEVEVTLKPREVLLWNYYTTSDK